MTAEQSFQDRLALEEGRRLLREAEERQVAAARECVNAFIEFAGRDDERKRGDGSPAALVQYPLHVQMQKDMDEHPWVAMMTAPRMGKTTQLALRAVWLIGRDPDIRIVISSKNLKADGTGAKIAGQIRNYIQNSPEVRRVFPHLYPGRVWKAQNFIVRRPSQAKDPTVQLVAPPRYVQGSRVDLWILDDVYDAQSTATERDRKGFVKWFNNARDRLHAKSRIILMCNPFHPRDFAHDLELQVARNPVTCPWVVRRIPVYEPVSETDLTKVRITLPEFYSIEYLEHLRRTTPALEFRRQYLCEAVDETESPFDLQLVQKMFRRPDDHHGDGVGDRLYDHVTLEEQRDIGCEVVIGVDLAARKHAKADQTVFTVVMVWRRYQVYQIVWIESGRWRSDEIGRRLIDLDRRFRPAMILVENNGAQDYIFQVLELLVENERLQADDDDAVPYPPVYPFTTTSSNKHHAVNGIDGLSAEISRGMWVFPAIHEDGGGSCHQELCSLRVDLISYSRQAHTGDHLMSLWLAREAARARMYDDDDPDATDEGSQFTVIGA